MINYSSDDFMGTFVKTGNSPINASFYSFYFLEDKEVFKEKGFLHFILHSFKNWDIMHNCTLNFLWDFHPREQYSDLSLNVLIIGNGVKHQDPYSLVVSVYVLQVGAVFILRDYFEGCLFGNFPFELKDYGLLWYTVMSLLENTSVDIANELLLIIVAYGEAEGYCAPPMSFGWRIAWSVVWSYRAIVEGYGGICYWDLLHSKASLELFEFLFSIEATTCLNMKWLHLPNHLSAYISLSSWNYDSLWQPAALLNSYVWDPGIVTEMEYPGLPCKGTNQVGVVPLIP